MKIEPFHTERFFAAHEFSAPYLLCASDCESLTVEELLQPGRRPVGLARASCGWATPRARGLPRCGPSSPACTNVWAPSSVIGLSAPEEGIFLTMHALLEPEDEVIVVSPCYDSLAQRGIVSRLPRHPLVAGRSSRTARWSRRLAAGP